MNVLILTGPSGCGKTTTIIPALERILPGTCVDTGDYGKALMVLQHCRPPEVPEPNWFDAQSIQDTVLSNWNLLSMEYEANKGPELTMHVIRFFESARSVQPDWPVQSVSLVASHNLLPGDWLITTTVSEEELSLLTLRWPAAVVVGLDCKNPVSRGQVDNRKPAFHKAKVVIPYWLEESPKVAEFIAGYVENYG